jgi:hypothetical protein
VEDSQDSAYIVIIAVLYTVKGFRAKSTRGKGAWVKLGENQVQ